jgi:hypothetical protein
MWYYVTANWQAGAFLLAAWYNVHYRLTSGDLPMRIPGRGLAAIASTLLITAPAVASVSGGADPSLPKFEWAAPSLHGHETAQTTPTPEVPVPPAAAQPATPSPVPQPDVGPAPEEPADGATDDHSILPDLSPAPEDDDFSVGEIPAVETVELTDDSARKALDAYVLVREKYKDAALENYESLQDFVDQNAQGKEFETDLKSFGFSDASSWNVTISTVSFAYANMLDDQSADIRQQIEEVKQDAEMAQDMRDRMVQALTAMIPSDNNKAVLERLAKDPVYSEKMKQLETEEE